MRSPCEDIVWNVLPCIRASIAAELIKHGLAQSDVSLILGITPSAVSQYVSKKRGYNIEFCDEIKSSISKLAEDLIQRRVDPTEGICKICMMQREEEKK
ncbi:MAG TPA: transcriptional regulator [Methanothrix soehngenii]|nr:transcriptional regulator [Methanothrix soehngenii]